MKLTDKELDLIKKAISYMSSNLPDVEEALDVIINYKDVEELEEKLYKEELK